MVGMKKIEKFGKVYINHDCNHLKESEKYTELKTAIFSNLDMKWYDICGDVHTQAENYRDNRISLGLTIENVNRYGSKEKFEGKFDLPIKFGELSSPAWDYVEEVARVEWDLAQKFRLVMTMSESSDDGEDEDDDLIYNDWASKTSKMFRQAQGMCAFLAPKRKLLESDFLAHLSLALVVDELLDSMTDGGGTRKAEGSTGFKSMEYSQLAKYFSQVVDIFQGKGAKSIVWRNMDITGVLQIPNIGLDQMLQLQRIYNGLIDVATVLQEEALRLAGEDKAVAGPFLNSLVECFHAETLNASREWNQKDHSVFREAQAELGNATCGMVIALEAISLQMGVRLTEQIRSCFIFKSLVHEFAKHSTKANDFISYNKEFMNGEGAQNEVYILHIVEEMSLVDALTKVVDDANQSLRKVEEYEKLLLKIFQNDQQLVQYTQIMKDMICGYFQWLHVSTRYHTNVKFDCYID